jgi:hypothetical protein
MMCLFTFEMCWCYLWEQKHSIFTYDNWNAMIWKDKYKRVSEWNCQVGDHMTNYGKKNPYTGSDISSLEWNKSHNFE